MFQYIAQGGFSCWLIFIKWMYIICANLQGERKPGKREVLILLIFTSPITFPQLAHLNWLHIQSRSLPSCNLVIMRKTPVGGHFIETLRFLGPRGFSMQVLILVFSINLVSNFSYLFYFPLKKKKQKKQAPGCGMLRIYWHPMPWASTVCHCMSFQFSTLSGSVSLKSGLFSSPLTGPFSNEWGF